MLLDAAFDNRKPQAVPGPAARIRGPEERFEDALLLRGRYPDATVSDLDHVVLQASAQADHNRPIRILQRIGQEIVQHLAQPERVGGYRKLLSHALKLQPPALLVVPHELFAELTQVERTRIERQSLHPRPGQEQRLRDNRLHAENRLLHPVKDLLGIRPATQSLAGAASQHAGVAQDHEERVAQVMHDSPEKLHRPFHLLFLPLPLALAAAEPDLNRAQQVVQVHRLRQVIVRPEAHALTHLAWLGLAREKDERDIGELRVASQRCQHLVAVHAGHVQVAHDEVRQRLGRQAHARLPIRGCHHRKALLGKEPDDHLAKVRLVINDEYLSCRAVGISLHAALSMAPTAAPAKHLLPAPPRPLDLNPPSDRWPSIAC